jgi:hypothetical protein
MLEKPRIPTQVRTETKFGPDHQESQDAARSCRSAHRVRYGSPDDLGERVLDLLVDTRDALGMEEEGALDE